MGELLKASIWSHSGLCLQLVVHSRVDPSRSQRRNCCTGPPPSSSVEQTGTARHNNKLLFSVSSEGFEFIPASGTQTACIVSSCTLHLVLRYDFNLSFLSRLQSGSETGFLKRNCIAKGVYNSWLFLVTVLSASWLDGKVVVKTSLNILFQEWPFYSSFPKLLFLQVEEEKGSSVICVLERL